MVTILDVGRFRRHAAMASGSQRETEVISRPARTICFAQSLIKADDVVIAANGTVPRGAEEAIANAPSPNASRRSRSRDR